MQVPGWVIIGLCVAVGIMAWIVFAHLYERGRIIMGWVPAPRQYKSTMLLAGGA